MAPDAQTAYAVLTRSCGMVDRSARGKLALTGEEAAGLLSGQVTNEIEALADGHGCYAALLTNKGKMLGDLRVLRIGGEAPELHLDCERTALQALFDQLRRAAIGWKAELHKRTVQEALLSLVGPEAGATLAAAAGGSGSLGAGDRSEGRRLTTFPEEEHAHVAVEVGGAAVRAITTDVGIDVLCAAEDAERLREALLRAGAEPVDEATAEVLRVATGRPRYGVDLDDGVIPQEAGLNERAVSFTKGCYVGQETVARMHWRGKPNRHLRGVRLAGEVGEGAALTSAEGKRVGAVSSVGEHPELGWIALALIRREVEPGAVVAVEGGGDATVVALPFS